MLAGQFHYKKELIGSKYIPAFNWINKLRPSEYIFCLFIVKKRCELRPWEQTNLTMCEAEDEFPRFSQQRCNKKNLI